MALARIVGLFASPWDLLAEGISAMASSTVEHTLTTSWVAMSTVEDTVLISMNPEAAGKAEVAVADAIEDLGGSDRGHQLTPIDFPAINFFNLSAKIVFARKRITSETVKLIVTAY